MFEVIKVIKNFLKQHYLAMIFAIVVGLVSVLPQFLAIKAIGSDYNGIHFMYTANEDVYMARIQEIVDGHWVVGSAFFYEYKSWKTLVPPIGEYFYAIPVILLRATLPNILIATKFLFPAIFFVLVYFLILKLSLISTLLSTKINATVGGLFVTLGYDLIDHKSFISLLLNRGYVANLPLWTRPVNPITGALLIFVFLLLIWKIINNGRRWLVLPAGLVWGLMIGYFFSWSISFAATMILLIMFLFRKNYDVAKNLLFVCVVFFITSLPYWLNIFSTMGSLDGRDRAAKNGMFFTHAPVINKVVLAISLFFLVISVIEYFYTKELKKENWWWFCLALIGGSWLVYNQQTITGRTIWYYHFVQYTIPFSIIVAMVLWVNYVKSRFFKLWAGGIVFVLLCVVIFNVLAQKGYTGQYENFRSFQKQAGIFLWLNQNAPKDCVVMAQEETEYMAVLIPALTHCNVYASTWVFDGVPKERATHNYLVWLKMNGVGQNNVEEYIINHQSLFRAYFFDNWDHLFSIAQDDWFKNMLNKTVISYKEFLNKNFEAELKKYRLDYILFEKQPSKDFREILPTVREVYSSVGYYLYKF